MFLQLMYICLFMLPLVSWPVISSLPSSLRSSCSFVFLSSSASYPAYGLMCTRPALYHSQTGIFMMGLSFIKNNPVNWGFSYKTSSRPVCLKGGRRGNHTPVKCVTRGFWLLHKLMNSVYISRCYIVLHRKCFHCEHFKNPWLKEPTLNHLKLCKDLGEICPIPMHLSCSRGFCSNLSVWILRQIWKREN